MTEKGRKRRGRYERVPVRKRISLRKLTVLLAAVTLLTAVTVGGTLAYLFTVSGSVANTFGPGQMSCRIEEDFSDGEHKKEVRVVNTGDGPAYIRVRLVAYWYDKEKDEIIAKEAWEPEFEVGAGWVRGGDGCYYHRAPVAPEGATGILIPSVTLTRDPVTLARPVLEIIASCVQAKPAEAVKEAWSGANGSVTGVNPDETLQIAGG